MALEHQIYNLEIVGDSMNVILALKGLEAPSWKINYMIQEAIAIIHSLANFSINHCFREANRFVDCLVNHGCQLNDGSQFLSPSEIWQRADLLQIMQEETSHCL